MSIGTCKLCGETRALVHAHIVPDAFYQRIKKADGAYIESRGDGGRSRRETGEFDKHLTCEGCDTKILGSLDTYAYKFLSEQSSWEPVHTRDS